MQCWQCGANIRPGQKLCVYCGAKLTPDGDSDHEAPTERGGPSGSGRDRAGGGGEREPRSPSAGGARGGRSSEGVGASSGRRADGWSAAPEYEAHSDRYGQRDPDPDRERESYYQPNRQDVDARGDSRSPRRSGGSRPSAYGPLDDPRAPRSLRGASSGGRSGERGRGRYESQDYDDAEYEYDDYNPRDRTSPRYLPRFDPESAEYDAVADQRRQSRLRPRSAESRSRASEWEDPRAGRSLRDGRQREGFGRAPRDEHGGGYSAYSGSAGDESAEYPASYDERAGWHDRGAGPSRGGRGAVADPQGYGGGWEQDQYGGWGADGFNAPAPGGMGRSGAPSWSGGAWAPPGAGGAYPGASAPPQRRSRRGLIAAVIALVVVLLGAGGGFLARGEIRALLHRGGASNTPAPSAFATYTPGPTPTVLSNYKRYSSANSKYVIEYPTAWSIQSDNSPNSAGYDYADIFEQQSPLAVVGVESAAAFNAASNSDIIQAEVNGVKEGAKQTTLTFTQIGSDVTVSVGGESWTRRDYNVAEGNGVTLHIAILATHHFGHGYSIVLTSAASDFVKDDTGVFKTMLGTFRFTS